MRQEKKRLSWIGRLLSLMNLLLAITLFLSSLSSFIDPSRFRLAGLLGLGFPILLIINLFFMLFWMVKVRPQFLFSLLAILFSWQDVASLYKLNKEEKVLNLNRSIDIMTYNVRMFNRYDWIDDVSVPAKIDSLVKAIQPQILCIQEFYNYEKTPSFDFKYEVRNMADYQKKYGLVIYSNYEVIRSGQIDYPIGVDLGTNKFFQFADLLIDSDTIRIINVHLASLNLDEQDLQLVDGAAEIDKWRERKGEFKKIGSRIGNAFLKRGRQMKAVLYFVDASPYPIILCGDFNDTPSSWAYSQMEKRFTDSFVEGGRGFGRTYQRFLFPLRIDHVFLSNEFRVIDHRIIKKALSDHFGVVVRFSLE